MKTRFLMAWLFLLHSSFAAFAATTINTANKFSYGANIGWMDWRGDTNTGAVIGEFVCSGFIYSANVGWINLGGGAPDNGFQYANTIASDFGVNHDGVGNLRGYAYGANIGWINFENTGNPRVNLRTGVLDGYVWGANVGWISLSNAFAVVKTDSFFHGGDKDEDGIPDQWEYLQTGDIEILSGEGHDEDGDGLSDVQEYLADTDPLDANDNLRITSYSMVSSKEKDVHTLTWTSRPTRFYKFNSADNFNPGFSFSSINELISPEPGPTTTGEVSFSIPSDQRFLRIEAVRPLSP